MDNNNFSGENGTSQGENSQPVNGSGTYGSQQPENTNAIPPNESTYGTSQENPVPYGSSTAYGQPVNQSAQNSGYTQNSQNVQNNQNIQNSGYTNGQQGQNYNQSYQQTQQNPYGGQNYSQNNNSQYQNQNYGRPNNNQNGYQYAQPNYNSNYSSDPNKLPLTTGEWILTLVVMLIPCVNLIMMFVWAFGDGNEGRRNFCRAQLILWVIAIVLSVIFVIIMVASFGSMSYFWEEVIRDLRGY